MRHGGSTHTDRSRAPRRRRSAAQAHDPAWRSRMPTEDTGEGVAEPVVPYRLPRS